MAITSIYRLPSMEDFVWQFNDLIHPNELGDTAEFWMQCTNHLNLCLTLIEAVKTNKFYLYRYCLIQICALFFAYNGQNYPSLPISFQFTCYMQMKIIQELTNSLKNKLLVWPGHLFLEIDDLLKKI